MTTSESEPEELHPLEPRALELLVVVVRLAVGRELDLGADLGLWPRLRRVDDDVRRASRSASTTAIRIAMCRPTVAGGEHQSSLPAR